jgi:arylsulfatase A-like enzyme
MREMRLAITEYLRILRPWLCVIVYLWLLELQAAVGLDAEPLLDRLADAGAILWTLILWTGGLSVAIFLLSNLFTAPTISRVNHSVCCAAVIFITAFHFVLWLHKLKPHHPGLDITLILILASCALFSAWALRRRKARQASDGNWSVPSLDDCFYFAVLPIIVVFGLALAVKISHELTAHSPVAHASSSKNPVVKSPPSIILIIADGLRAQNMSVYGYSRKTTPHLERFARQANVYMQMHSNGTTTQPSMTTILSGRHPFSHGRLTRETSLYRDPRNLLRVLRDNGYTTAAITSNKDASVYSLGFGADLSQREQINFGNLTLSWFRDAGVLPTSMGMRMYEKLAGIFPFLGFPGSTSPYGSSDHTFNKVKKAMGTLDPPFFLLVHLHDPHDPYYRSAAFSGVFSGADHSSTEHKFPTQFYGYYPPELQSFVSHHRDHYDESIQFLDAEFGKFMSFLGESRFSDKLVLAFTADHGESFERGYFNHGEDLYESSTHVPLIIRFAHQRESRKVGGLVQSTDIAPTILHAIGVAVPPWMDGQALTEGGNPRDADTIAINFKHPRKGVHYPLPTRLALWSGHHKLIVHCDGSKLELYDLAEDPAEQLDRSAQSSTTVRALKGRLTLHLSARSQEPVMPCLYD